MKSTHPYDLVIGLDRSDKKADLTIIDTRSGKASSQTLPTSPENLHTWLARLRQAHPKARVAVCVEQPAINIILFLETYAWITLFPINPISLQKYREAFVTSRAKDDVKDAQFLADLILNHHDKFTPWAPDDEQTRQLRHLVSHRRTVVDKRTALTNRLQGLLKQFFPQALELCGDDLWRPLATSFLLKWPTLQAVQKARPETIRGFYHVQGSRSQTLLQKRLQLIAQAVPLTDERALLESYTLRVQLICKQLQLAVRTIAAYDDQITEAFAAHPDKAIYASLPGAGPTLAPRLLATMGSDRNRFTTAKNLQAQTGVAPVTKQSGDTRYIHRRYRCPKFARQSFHEFANQSVLQCRWAAAYYHQQRAKGCYHHTAVRALAYKWQRIIFRCWLTNQPYDDARYEDLLRRRKSHVVKFFDMVEVGKNPFKATSDKNGKK